MNARPIMVAILLGFQALAHAEHSHPMIVQIGRPFKLSLAANPTTGYQWQFATPLDEMHLKLLKTEYKKPTSGLAGAEGMEILEFKPLAEGETQIQLKYARPWEPDTAPAHTTNFVLKIVKRAGD